MSLTIGSLFSGIGGFELGLEWAGLGPVLWQVEIDAWCRSVLARHWPDVRRFADVRTVGREQLAPVDIVCGGFPCQDVSAAGKRAGINGARSGLWREQARIVAEVRPRFVLVENVSALATRGLDVVVSDLGRLGYRVEARIISAADVGAPHRRARLFVVAYARDHGCDEQRARVDVDGDHASRDVTDGCDPSMANAARERHEEGRDVRKGRGRHAGAEPFGGQRRSAQSRLGRCPHGISDRLERWPSRPGDAAAVWEPPRSLVPYSPVRARRLSALGNAIVPQCAYEVGLRVRQIAGLE